MSYEDFIKQIKGNEQVSLCSGDPEYRFAEYKRGEKVGANVDYIYVQNETGGVSGGSCWDSSNPHPYTNTNPKEDFIELDVILEMFNSNISFIQYKNLKRSVVHTVQYTSYEYYGNHTDYEVEYVILKELYDYLSEKSWLPS